MTVTLADVARWLAAYEIEFDVADQETPDAGSGRATVELHRGRSHRRTKLLYGSHITLTDALTRLDGNATVIATSAVSPRTARAFRQAGLHYVDSVGNASLQFGDVVIDVQGRHATAQFDSKATPPVNVFTPNRAKVVCVLLTWPPLWNAPRREVARVAGVSVGQTHQTLRSLTELGFEGRRPDASRLLELWSAAFPAALARRLYIDSFRGSLDGLIETDQPIYVSGERAVDDLLRPGSQVVYVPEFDVELPRRNRWRRDAHPNVVVRKAFWQDPQGDTAMPLVRPAPWPLVYADLANSHDSRARNAADIWREQHA